MATLYESQRHIQFFKAWMALRTEERKTTEAKGGMETRRGNYSYLQLRRKERMMRCGGGKHSWIILKEVRVKLSQGDGASHTCDVSTGIRGREFEVASLLHKLRLQIHQQCHCPQCTRQSMQTMRAARASLNDGFFEVRNEEGRKARTSPDSFIVSDQARIPTTGTMALTRIKVAIVRCHLEPSLYLSISPSPLPGHESEACNGFEFPLRQRTSS